MPLSNAERCKKYRESHKADQTERRRPAAKKYYEKNKEKISKKAKEKYLIKHGQKKKRPVKQNTKPKKTKDFAIRRQECNITDKNERQRELWRRYYYRKGAKTIKESDRYIQKLLASAGWPESLQNDKGLIELYKEVLFAKRKLKNSNNEKEVQKAKKPKRIVFSIVGNFRRRAKRGT